MAAFATLLTPLEINKHIKCRTSKRRKCILRSGRDLRFFFSLHFFTSIIGSTLKSEPNESKEKREKEKKKNKYKIRVYSARRLNTLRRNNTCIDGKSKELFHRSYGGEKKKYVVKVKKITAQAT